jgi:hypothetical protein
MDALQTAKQIHGREVTVVSRDAADRLAVLGCAAVPLNRQPRLPKKNHLTALELPR